MMGETTIRTAIILCFQCYESLAYSMNSSTIEGLSAKWDELKETSEIFS